MGKSITVNLIGVCKNKDEHFLYTASNVTEMAQECIKAKRAGEPITHWYAQTQAGVQILARHYKGKDDLRFFDVYQCVPDSDIDLTRMEKSLVSCPCCGHFEAKDRGCQVCNWSGVATKRHLSRYRPWQLEPSAAPRRVSV